MECFQARGRGDFVKFTENNFHSFFGGVVTENALKYFFAGGCKSTAHTVMHIVADTPVIFNRAVGGVFAGIYKNAVFINGASYNFPVGNFVYSAVRFAVFKSADIEGLTV